MKKHDEDEEESTKVDVKQVLLTFWLEAIENAPDYSDRLKASDNLAKYFLAEGTQRVKMGVAKRPATSEILRFVDEDEKGTHGLEALEEGS